MSLCGSLSRLCDALMAGEAGNFASSEILVLLGQNGCGKDRLRLFNQTADFNKGQICFVSQTTFIRMLAGLLNPDDVKEGRSVLAPGLPGNL